MRFFLRYLSLEGKKSLIAARKSMVKFFSDVITDRRRIACGQSRYVGCRCVPDGGDWRCDP